jgi:hypothetical protein
MLVMIEPSIEFQQAVFATLRAANIGPAIYEVVPPNSPFPFIVIGDDNVETNRDYPDIPWWDCYSTVHVFSQPAVRSHREVKTIASQVATALNVRLSFTSFYCYEWEHLDTQYMTDKDGVTEHAMVKLCWKVQPNDSNQ